jgi:hypothetical protein
MKIVHVFVEAVSVVEEWSKMMTSKIHVEQAQGCQVCFPKWPVVGM